MTPQESMVDLREIVHARIYRPSLSGAERECWDVILDTSHFLVQLAVNRPVSDAVQHDVSD